MSNVVCDKFLVITKILNKNSVAFNDSVILKLVSICVYWEYMLIQYAEKCLN